MIIMIICANPAFKQVTEKFSSILGYGYVYISCPVCSKFIRFMTRHEACLSIIQMEDHLIDIGITHSNHRKINLNYQVLPLAYLDFGQKVILSCSSRYIEMYSDDNWFSFPSYSVRL